MNKIRISLLRGVCQTPAYVAYEKEYFRQEGLDAELTIEPTAVVVPQKLDSGESHFAVMPWTRAAVSQEKGAPLVLLCGSGIEEAAIVVRSGLKPSQVRKIAIPLRGGIKDLTAMGLIETLGWKNVEIIRQPSGDGAIISFFGQGADAASMVEPYATMLTSMGIARVVKRTGDLWKGAPGCSLAATARLVKTNPLLVQRVVTAFVRGAAFVDKNPELTAKIASGYIGVNARFIRDALDINKPDVNAIRNTGTMEAILTLMIELGYTNGRPTGFTDLTFLDKAQEVLKDRICD